MKWPKKLIIKIADLKNQDSSNLVVYITLCATKKNDYSLGPYLTDNEGKVAISKQVVKEAISNAMKDFPMDYSDMLGDCKNEIIVEIESKESLFNIWNGIKDYYPECAESIRILLDGKANFISHRLKKCFKINDTVEVITISIDG